MKLIKILFISITIILLSVGCLYAADNNTDYENSTPTTTQDMSDLNVVDNEILSENTNNTINDSKDLNATDNKTISENNNQTNDNNFHTIENISMPKLHKVENFSEYDIITKLSPYFNISDVFKVENITDFEILRNISHKYPEFNNSDVIVVRCDSEHEGLLIKYTPTKYPIIKYLELREYPYNEVVYINYNIRVTENMEHMEIEYSDNTKLIISSPNKKIIKYIDKIIIEYSDDIRLIEYSNGTGELIFFNTTTYLNHHYTISPIIVPMLDKNTTNINNTNDTYKTVTNTDLKKSTHIKTVVKAPKVTSKFKKSKFFQIKITDKKSKKPVSCKIKVKVYTGKKFKTYTLKTNKKGIAKFNVKTLKKGSHKVVIRQNNNKYSVNSQSKIVIK